MTAERICWKMVEPGAPLVQSPLEPWALEADDVVVEIAGCGVCHTDLGFLYGGVRTNHELPLTLGHEISGRVIDAGGDASRWVDRAVIVPAVIPCGTCDACLRGNATICVNQKMPGNDIDGGFATHVVVPARGLCEVDEKRLVASGLELADLSVIADAVTTPYQAVLRAGVSEGDTVIVNGVGGIGGYAVQIASVFGASVIAVDIDEEKLEATKHHGAVATVNAREKSSRDIKSQIQSVVGELGLRESEWIVMECSGTRAGQEVAFSLINRGATLAVVGFTMEKVEIRLSNLMALHARAIGNWGCLPEHYGPALDLVINGQVEVAPFIEKHPLSEINRILDAVHHGQIKRRPVLVPPR